MTGRTQHGARTYRCRASKGHMSRAAEPADAYVAALVVERLSRPDARELLLDDTAPDLDDHRERIAALRVRLDDLASALADGVLPLPAVARMPEPNSSAAGRPGRPGSTPTTGRSSTATTAPTRWCRQRPR